MSTMFLSSPFPYQTLAQDDSFGFLITPFMGVDDDPMIVAWDEAEAEYFYLTGRSLYWPQ